MSVCDWDSSPETPAPEVVPPVVPPVVSPMVPPTPSATMTPGWYTARHPHWRGSIVLNADGTYARDNGDPGTSTYDGITLVLAWRNWAPERLTRQADGSFRAASNGFTIRLGGN